MNIAPDLQRATIEGGVFVRAASVELGLGLGAGAAVVAVVALGAAVGLSLDVLLRRMDRKVHGLADARRAADMPVLSSLPFDGPSATSRRNPRVSLASLERPDSAIAEAVRSLRAVLAGSGAGTRFRSVCVTSARADEGKSLIAANVALASAQAGVRTLLLSADLRRPSLDARLLPTSRIGFTDAVLDGLPARRAIYRTTVEGLTFVPAGRPVEGPSELLASAQARRVLAALAEHCDLLVIDSPPTVLSDAVLLAAMADTTIVVVAANQSSVASVRQSVEQLRVGGAHVLGVVLNKARRGRDLRTATESRAGEPVSLVRNDRRVIDLTDPRPAAFPAPNVAAAFAAPDVRAALGIPPPPPQRTPPPPPPPPDLRRLVPPPPPRVHELPVPVHAAAASYGLQLDLTDPSQ